jgi:RES domain-containing protein
MRIFRLVKSRYQTTCFSGEGAKRYAGRWNSRGVAVAYSSSTLSLSVLEILVHLDTDQLPADLVVVEAELDDAQVEHLGAKKLPRDWQSTPAPRALARIGDAWVRSGRTLALAVPSALVDSNAENNVLINPLHPAFLSSLVVVSSRPFVFDPRFRSK